MLPGHGPGAVLFDMGGTLEDVSLEPETSALGEALLASRLRDAGVIPAADAGLAALALMPALAPGELTALIEEGLATYKREMHLLGDLVELPPLEIWSRWLLNHQGFAPARLTAELAEELSLLYETRCLVRRLRPEAVPLIEELAHRGYRLGVISNSISMTQVAQTLRLHGLQRCFATVQVSALAGRRKPHPLMFLTAAAELGVEPGRCMYVGDTLTRDVFGARAARYGYALLMRSALGLESDGRDAADLVAAGAMAPIWERSIRTLDQVLDSLDDIRAVGGEGESDGYAAS